MIYRFVFLLLLITSLCDAVTPQDKGAAGNAQKVEDAVLTGASTTVTSATANFAPGDVGKTVFAVENSTGLLYLPRGTITAVLSTTQITVSVPAIGAASGARLVWGRDDTAEVILAKDEAQATKSPLRIPAGGYLVRKRFLGVSYTSHTRAFPIIGEGSGVTTFYVCPDFDYTGVGPYEVLLGGNLAHAYGASWSGFTIDGCDGKFTHPLGGVNDLLLPICGSSHASLEDVRIENFKGVGVALKLYGNCLMQRCHVEDAGECGIFWYGEGTALHCYSGNIAQGGSGTALRVHGVTGNGPFKWIGGILDECGGPSTAEVDGSVDVHFVGAMIYAGIGRAAVRVDSTSEVRFTASQLTPYAAHWGTAVKVLPGGRVNLLSTRLRGVSPGKAIEGAKGVGASTASIIEGEVAP